LIRNSRNLSDGSLNDIFGAYDFPSGDELKKGIQKSVTQDILRA